MKLNDVDRELLRAWELFDLDFTDQTFAEVEKLLPALVAAGYAKAQDDRWGFTPKGISRAEALERVAPDTK